MTTKAQCKENGATVITKEENFCLYYIVNTEKKIKVIPVYNFKKWYRGEFPDTIIIERHVLG